MKPSTGGYLFALDQVRNAMRELRVLTENLMSLAPTGAEKGTVDYTLAKMTSVRAYLVDAEAALDDSITETPATTSHGQRRTGGVEVIAGAAGFAVTTLRCACGDDAAMLCDHCGERFCWLCAPQHEERL